MRIYKYIIYALAMLCFVSCSVGARMQRGNYAADLAHIPRPKPTVPPQIDTLPPTPKYNAIEITRPDSTKMFFIPVTDVNGERMPTLTIEEVVVVVKSRHVSERGGKVNLDFIVNIPKELMGNIQSVMVTPYLLKNEDAEPLEDIAIRGNLFSRVQERNYWQFDRYNEVFKPDEAGRRWAFERFVTYPYPEGVRLDSIVDNATSLAYHYTQEVKTTEAGNRMMLTLRGRVVALDHSYYELPLTDTLMYNVSSMSDFVDTTKRYMTQIVQKYVVVQDRNYLNFKVNDTRIIDSLAGNAAQLERIDALMDEILNQKEFHVDGITLTASASPEGSLRHNDRLAEGRAKALRDRFAGKYKDVDKILSVKWIGEDWDELVKLIEATRYSDIIWKREILALISGGGDMDRMERTIKEKYPHSYKFMLENLYPQLRAVTFQYDLRRVGMVQDTIHTTVVNEKYMRGVKLLQGRKYAEALDILRPYADRNTAVVFLSLGADREAYDVLCSLYETPEVAYLKAIANARLGRRDEALAAYERASEADDFLKYRGRLDPEISELITENSL